MARIAVIYYSSTGTTHRMATALAEGATSAGAEVRLRRVPELAPEAAVTQNPKWKQHLDDTKGVEIATLADLEWADGLAFGTPTRYGLPTAQLKQFLDQTGPLWGQGKLVNKVVTSFCTTATAHGGQETTITALNNTFYHWGAIIVPLGYVEPSQFQSGNPYGASHVSANGTIPPDEHALTAARLQGRRLAEVAARFHR